MEVHSRCRRVARLLDWVSPRVFLKQYGERRTGTNFLRVILLLNYRRVTPLMHVLGDKHSAPVDWEEVLRRTSGQPDADAAFVREATLAMPAENTLPGHPERAAYMQRLAEPLARAVRQGRVGFLVSIKHPLVWAGSYAKYQKWCHEVEGKLRAACRDFNQRHRAWWRLVDEHPERTFVVPHERLCAEPLRVLAELERKFGLRRRRWKRVFPRNEVNPTVWDHDPPHYGAYPFSRRFYSEQRYKDLLVPEIRRVVEETIDWGLMRRFGYDPSGPPVVRSR